MSRAWDPVALTERLISFDTVSHLPNEALCAHLEELLRKMEREGILHAHTDLGFLTTNNCAQTLTEAAYRFCAHEPGVDVVLTGTGDSQHLETNIAAALKPPLPPKILERLEALLGHIDSVTGN